MRKVVATAVMVFAVGWTVPAQVLLDRVLARVNGVPVTLSDVRQALAMGLVVAAPDEMDLALEQVIQRQLLVSEVERFPPPEPDAAAVDREVETIRTQMRTQTSSPAMPAIDERQVRQSARDTLRIRAYLEQRFGTSGQVGDEEVRAYYAAHPDEFSRDGMVLPFEQVEPTARARASAERRDEAVRQWINDLRGRADVVIGRL